MIIVTNEGATLNILNGIRLECMAVDTTRVKPSRPYSPFYLSGICYPDRPDSPYGPFPCMPAGIHYEMRNATFFAFAKLDWVTCLNPSDWYQNCYLVYEQDVHVTLYPNREELIAAVLRNYIELIDGDPIDSGYLYNLLDNPEFLSHMALILGIPDDYMFGDYGYAVVHIEKKGIMTQTNIDLSKSALNHKVNEFISELTAATVDDEIVKMMSKYGTHYFTGRDSSDYMLQVFVYEKSVYGNIDRAWNIRKQDGANFIRYARNVDANNARPTKVGKLKTFGSDPLAFGYGPGIYICSSGVNTFFGDRPNGLESSIFKFHENQKEIERKCEFRTNHRIKLRVGSLSNLLLGSQYPALKEKWDRVLQETITYRFGLPAYKNVIPDFWRQLTYPNPAASFSFYDSFNPRIVTHTGSVYTSLIQMHYDLNDIQSDILNPSTVKHILIMADIIEVGPNNVDIPGTENIYIICRHLISHSTLTTHPTMYVHTDNVYIAAQEITGVLRVLTTTSNTTYVYYNELVYKTVDDPIVLLVKYDRQQDDYIKQLGPHTVNIYNVPQGSSIDMPQLYTNDPNDKLSTFLHRAFSEGFELAMVTTEVILSLGTSTDQDSIPTTVKCLDWIASTLSQGASNANSALSTDQEEILSRALLIKTTKVPFYLSNHIMVPRLTYQFYKPYYDTILTLTELYRNDLDILNTQITTNLLAEKIAANQQELNNNIKEIGRYLVAETTANMEKQEDMKSNYEQLIIVNEDIINKKQSYGNELFTEIGVLQKEAWKIGETLKSCILRETIISIIFSVVDVVSTLFPVPGAKNPAQIPAKISKIKKVIDKIRKVIAIMAQLTNAMSKLKNIGGTVSTMNRALEGLSSTSITDQFPTKVEWSDFDAEIEQYTTSATLPSACTGDGADYKAASKKISSRGRVYLELQADIQKLQYEILTLALQKETAVRHSNRLQVLSNSLSQSSIPNEVIDSANLYEIGFFIQMGINEVRLDLAQVYINMDAALQHYYLQPPSPFAGYTTKDIVEATVSQMVKAESALNSFSSPPTEFSVPFDFNIPNVLVDDVHTLSGITFPISITDVRLLAYQRVRVLEVRIWVDSVSSSTNGHVQVEALASGEFDDRDAYNNIRHFASEPISFPFVYEIATKQIVKNNRPTPDFAITYMKITPFTDWIIRINPNHPTNVGIKFSSTLTNIRIQLYLSAVASVSGR